MAIAVQSVSTNTMGVGGVLTKPTGLTVGDTMVAIVVAETTADLAAPGSWTGAATLNTASYAKSAVFYKVADSADVAAANFTFTGTNIRGGILYRISGAAIAENFVGTGTPKATDGLVIIWGIAGDNDGSNTSFSGYSVTGGASPTFTERLDSSENTGLSTALGVADAVYTSAAAITAFNVTIAAGMDETASQMIFINQQITDTAQATHLAITPTLENVTGANSSAGSATHLTITPTLQTVTAKSSSDTTRWTTVTKSSTTWTNTDKS